jgi:hypothetical protein
MGTRGYFSGVKRLGREADHSNPSSAEVKNAWSSILFPPNTPSLRGAHLKKSTGTTLLLHLPSGWPVTWPIIENCSFRI